MYFPDAGANKRSTAKPLFSGGAAALRIRQIRCGGLRALAAGLIVGLLTQSAQAQVSSSKKGGALRPTGPVKILSDRAEWQKGGAMVYSGNVRLESGDLKLSGKLLKLKQGDDGQFEATVIGEPATLDHAGIAGGSKDRLQPVSARAKELIYRSRTDTVEILGDARLTRGTDVIRGERVRYEVAQRRIRAAGQVEIVIQQPARTGAAQGETDSDFEILDEDPLPDLTPAIDETSEEMRGPSIPGAKVGAQDAPRVESKSK